MPGGILSPRQFLLFLRGLEPVRLTAQFPLGVVLPAHREIRFPDFTAVVRESHGVLLVEWRVISRFFWLAGWLGVLFFGTGALSATFGAITLNPQTFSIGLSICAFSLLYTRAITSMWRPGAPRLMREFSVAERETA